MAPFKKDERDEILALNMGVIAIGILCVLTWFLIGYIRGRIALVVYGSWNTTPTDVDDDAIRKFVFPLNSFRGSYDEDWPMVKAAKIRRNEGTYLFWNMLLMGQISIAWSLVMLAICYVMFPLLTFCITFAAETCVTFAQLFPKSSSTSTPSAQSPRT